MIARPKIGRMIMKLDIFSAHKQKVVTYIRKSTDAISKKEYSDFQHRLDTYAENMSLRIRDHEFARYLIPLENRGKFPELDSKNIATTTQIMSDLGIYQLFLLNSPIINIIARFMDGYAIKGTDYRSFRAESPEDAIRIERALRPKDLMEIYQ